jgi:uncharacterized repeat protein (TIGR03803 family)
MIDLRFGRYTLSVCVAVAMLAGCGGTQPPISPSPARVTAERTRSDVAYNVLYGFTGGSGDGELPFAGLVKVKGTLYGTTAYGGGFGCSFQLGCGTVFSVGTTGAEKVLHNFGGQGDGSDPVASLLNVNGTLYGTTLEGGANCSSCGTVFKITTSGAETVLHSFGGGKNEGFHPDGGLLNVNGTLYGMTNGGGVNDYGTVFAITTSGAEKVLYSFTGGSTDGEYPDGGLIDVKGTLYGTTPYGGAGSCNDHGMGSGCGTVFSVTTAGKEAVLYNFKGASGDGSQPSRGLLNVNGTLYGTTQLGGANGKGTVFAVTPSGKETVFYSFKGGSGDGSYPLADLTNVNGTLYGTTISGGVRCKRHSGCGTVFSVTPAGTETVLHRFKGWRGGDGAWPYAGLLNVNGTLYGTTYLGGRNNGGTVFSLTP